MVDGGPPQVAAAAAALEELGIDDVALFGLAKRLEEVWLPGEDAPGRSCRAPARACTCCSGSGTRRTGSRSPTTGSAGRGSMTASVLDGVPGLGRARRAALLKHFGSVQRLRAATAEEIAEVPGVGPPTAQAVVAALAATRPVPAVNVATGELLDD